MSPLVVADVHKKLELIETACHGALTDSLREMPRLPARDLPVITQCLDKNKRPGLSEAEGQAKLLHDVANIELQAMELAYRTLVEYPDSPLSFKHELIDLILQEKKHLVLCLNELDRLGFSWGHWPVHLHLWNSVSVEDSLLDRILIVHRYLEGSGLDASHILLAKLSGLCNQNPKKVIQVIAEEEEGHVAFGSRWYREICRRQRLNPQEDFKSRMDKIYDQIPKRSAKINRDLRLKVGFSEYELDVLDEIHERKTKKAQS